MMIIKGRHLYRAGAAQDYEARHRAFDASHAATRGSRLSSTRSLCRVWFVVHRAQPPRVEYRWCTGL
ncbi:hypothetical protein [Acidovorax sp. sic0104]|uniref:hypothetical protein n=1 Tax=Acidovorax sp. sic0104 TaxID=2854784 RepID=UPI001C46C1B9|nr:hypothetical protein [Acidovorax sp. sic0104]MBV7543217.1 hypothetical protein [Acidovorax sp. sic0104]